MTSMKPSSIAIPTTTSKPTTTTVASGLCANVAAWSSAIAYTGGMQVTYGGFLWTASWWTQADTPGGVGSGLLIMEI
ncbi:hypothetical protein BDN70DRAFT_932490 [Pholiota conissans]|uniref:Chitin-binding type-3 domain-containing protein n=1 Tax=Pholiota conissans TaxID=109636 RepID=A0A9P5Z1K6_9AGAR|nr:hypothetical protein BDN70DRAFT_932490 [Pholiota conissans]